MHHETHVVGVTEPVASTLTAEGSGARRTPKAQGPRRRPSSLAIRAWRSGRHGDRSPGGQARRTAEQAGSIAIGQARSSSRDVGAVLSCVDQGITDPRHDSRAVEGILVSNARQAIQVIGYREWNARSWSKARRRPAAVRRLKSLRL